MAIKGADLLHVGNKVLIERAQTAGPGQVNIPTEKIYELGNYYSIAQVRDIPDLSFSLESLDASAAMEAQLCGLDFGAMTDGTLMYLAKSRPMDVMSEFKNGFLADNPYDVVGAVALPYLVLESVSYKFGVTDKASQTATLKGDSIFYCPGSGYVQEVKGTGVAGQAITLAAQPTAGGADVPVPVFPYLGDVVAGTKYALSVTTSAGKRLTDKVDYTEVASGARADGARSVTITLTDPVPTTQVVRISFASPAVAQYPQASHSLPSKVRPAAIKGRNIEVFIGGEAIANRWTSVQSLSVDYKVTLDKDEEFGNAQVVSQDFDVPAVTGSLDIKPRDYTELVKRVRQIAGITSDTEVAGPLTAPPLELMVVLHNPDDGAVLKTLRVPDARFTLPGYSGRVQQKQTVTFAFESDAGLLEIYKGNKPAPVAP